MVAGVTIFPKAIEQAVEDKLAADPGLKKQWDEVSTRFHLVYADAEAAFCAVNVDAMLKDPAALKSTLAKIGAEPESFGALKGRTGIFVSRADKEHRETARVNAAALTRDLDRYLQMREAATQRLEAEEKAIRQRVSIDIPALSPTARVVLERVRDAIQEILTASGTPYWRNRAMTVARTETMVVLSTHTERVQLHLHRGGHAAPAGKRSRRNGERSTQLKRA